MLLWMAHALACPDLESILAAAEEDLVEVRTDAVLKHLREAEGALACGAPADPALLARMWLVEGVIQAVDGDAEGAAQAFSALARTDRSAWDDVYGTRIQSQYEEAAASPAGISKLRIHPPLGSNLLWVDGRKTAGKASVISGLHALQISDHTNSVRFGRVVYLQEGQILELETGVPPGPKVIREREGSRVRFKRPTWMIAGAGFGLAAGGCAGGALALNTQLQKAPTQAALDRGFAGQIALSSGTLLLSTAAVISIVRGVTRSTGRAKP